MNNFFSPTPTVSWTRVGKSMPSGRVQKGNSGQELIIENVQLSDAGRYECSGVNDESAAPVTYSFDLTVSVIFHFVISKLCCCRKKL